MDTYVALLRGINVGGHHRVAMTDLRRLCEDFGYRRVRTYLQSGNVVFASAGGEAATLEAALTEAITSRLGVPAKVMVRTAEDLGVVVAANPFTQEAAEDPTKVHVAFVASAPVEPLCEAMRGQDYAPEQLITGDRVAYLHLPAGMGRSRLATDLTKGPAGSQVTLRNWRTVTRLVELTEA